MPVCGGLKCPFFLFFFILLSVKTFSFDRFLVFPRKLNDAGVFFPYTRSLFFYTVFNERIFMKIKKRVRKHKRLGYRELFIPDPHLNGKQKFCSRDSVESAGVILR